MSFAEALKKLKEMQKELLHCDCNDEKCHRCGSHKDMTEEAIALQYAICYMEFNRDI